MKIGVIIPIYNAENSLEGVLKRIPLDAFKKISEFILINDGSTDNSQRVIDNLMQRYANLIVIVHFKNLGYGAAQKAGFKRALLDNMDAVVLLHSDGQYPSEMIMDIVKPIENGIVDIVGGSRILEGKVLKQGMPLVRYIGVVLLNAIENFIFKQKLTIYHSGYRCYSKKALEIINFSDYSNNFSFDSEMLVGAFINNLEIYEIPIPTYYRGTKSYLNPVKYVSEIILIILKYLLKQYNVKTNK